MRKAGTAMALVKGSLARVGDLGKTRIVISPAQQHSNAAALLRSCGPNWLSSSPCFSSLGLPAAGFDLNTRTAAFSAAQHHSNLRCCVLSQQLSSSHSFHSFPSTVSKSSWPLQTSSNRSIHSSVWAPQAEASLQEVAQQDAVDVEAVQNFVPPTKEGQKPRVVVLGTGWAACRFLKDLNPKFYDVVCLSPRNHMVFTPLLASTCVGTLEFRSVAEAVRTIQPALAREQNCFFFLARCTGIDIQNRKVQCKAIGKEETEDMTKSGEFTVAYDKLIIASGAQSLTFNIPGVYENAIFLREVADARAIRRKLLLNLALSQVPGVTESEKRKILHCVVVGGGPTGVEFSGELSDFIERDVIQKFSHVKDYIHVTLIEASEILSSFDVSLRQYATSHLDKAGVKLVKGVVKEVRPDSLMLSDGTVVPYGLLVWSTGVGPSEFVKSLPFQKSRDGRIGVDEYLRVPEFEDLYAIGDCSGYLESTGKPVLPALAQVAERQGKYLAKSFNSLGKAGEGRLGTAGGKDHVGNPFVYRHLGSLASVGRYKALVDLRENKASRGLSMAGFLSWVIWRSAYLTRVVSWRNRIYVAINWATTFVFGRDISRI